MSAEIRIFIVDDDPAIRDSLTAMLEAEAYSCTTFDSAAAFLDAYDDGAAGCLLLDVRMPGVDGLEFQKQLKTEGIDLPVILMTGHGDIQMAVAAMREGAVDFIEKPFAKEAILESLDRALGAGPPAPASAADAAAHVAFERLTPREMDVLKQLVIGNPNKVIAYELDISPRTVEIHRARVMEKTRAKNLSHLVRLAIAAGIDP